MPKRTPFIVGLSDVSVGPAKARAATLPGSIGIERDAFVGFALAYSLQPTWRAKPSPYQQQGEVLLHRIVDGGYQGEIS